MKFTASLILIATCFLFSAWTINNSDEVTHHVELEILGIKKIQGTIQIAVFNSSSTFLKNEKKYRLLQIPANQKKVKFRIKLPEGEYALAIFHDTNQNQKLDTNFLGIPMEAYGFSNNARRTFSAPRWEDCKFRLNESKLQRINLK